MRHIVDYRRKLRRCTSRAEAASALISKTCSARYRPARVHCVTAVNPADGNEWQPKREIELEIMENPSRGYLFLLPLSLSLSLSLSICAIQGFGQSYIIRRNLHGASNDVSFTQQPESRATAQLRLAALIKHRLAYGNSLACWQTSFDKGL